MSERWEGDHLERGVSYKPRERAEGRVYIALSAGEASTAETVD